MRIEFMTVLWMHISGPAELEAARQQAYEWAILTSRLKSDTFFKRTPVAHFKRPPKEGEK